MTVAMTQTAWYIMLEEEKNCMQSYVIAEKNLPVKVRQRNSFICLFCAFCNPLLNDAAVMN
jgi:hypothetical protein